MQPFLFKSLSQVWLNCSLLRAPRVPKPKIQDSKKKKKNLFCKILKNKRYHAKVLRNSFCLNGYIIGCRQQTLKLELHLFHVPMTLGVAVLSADLQALIRLVAPVVACGEQKLSRVNFLVYR